MTCEICNFKNPKGSVTAVIIKDFINWFSGSGFWKSESFPVLNHAYLIEINDEIILNKKENADYLWLNINDIKPEEIAFDSNQSIVKYLQKNLVNFTELKELISQLDSSANIKEINFYRSLLNGYFSKKVIDGKLIGVGWIYVRQTLLRKQAVLEDIIVDQNQRKKGYGEEITADLIRWAKENGVEMIELTTNPLRVAANTLYQKLGFKLHPTNHYLYTVE
ncbi:MAG: GNAT family N-acetyltransferase [Candidatus Staskawiczbacteria bacterium]|nr:GNAT family N-acetyltransferase [Candidatus Staskawiczbacteria bacterium]